MTGMLCHISYIQLKLIPVKQKKTVDAVLSPFFLDFLRNQSDMCTAVLYLLLLGQSSSKLSVKRKETIQVVMKTSDFVPKQKNSGKKK